MNKQAIIYPQTQLQPASLNLPASKSESNRVLIIQALAGKDKISLRNLSNARDTQTMIRLLESDDPEQNVLDAGTTMRFLTAYYAVTGKKRLLTGTDRMKERPIKILVKALKRVGCKIKYTENKGFPPLMIKSFPKQKEKEITMQGDVSSQYISAMLMVAPYLPEGLVLSLKGKVGSQPYIDMTVALMQKFGAQVEQHDQLYIIHRGDYGEGEYVVESDWSGASYWYSMVALAQAGELKLNGLHQNSLQGDITIAKLMNGLGVLSSFESDGVLLSKFNYKNAQEIDFTDCPDLAQTLAVSCSVLGIPATFTGLESLRIKETDRIAALQKELAKIGGGLSEISKGRWQVLPARTEKMPEEVRINTYDDHRMAMAFAALATRTRVVIKNPDVVVKSYPAFWDHLRQVGFRVEME